MGFVEKHGPCHSGFNKFTLLGIHNDLKKSGKYLVRTFSKIPEFRFLHEVTKGDDLLAPENQTE